jgi:hypothetical protein
LPIEESDSATTSVVETEKTSAVREVVRTVTEYVPVRSPAASPTLTPAPNTAQPPARVVTSEQNKLEISNFTTIESGDSTKATWQTNLKSDSRIMINDSFYVSDSNDSTTHSVRFTDLKKGVVINYQVIATTDDQEVNTFGKFSTRPGELDVRFAYSTDDECLVVVLEDENGTAQPGVSLKLSGAMISQDGRRMRPSDADQTRVTSSWGEIEYCNLVQEMSVQNISTGEYYHNGRIYLF